MKVLYIETKRNKPEDITLELNRLPKKLFLAYSIQYKKNAEIIKKQLERANFNILGFQQVLGCSKITLTTNTPILLIGSGRFHALNLALQGYEVYVYNNSAINKIGEEDIKKLKQNKQVALNRFFSSTNIGFLISTKPGQNRIGSALDAKDKILKKYPEKRVNLFVSNNINLNEFENFPIDLWVNTACPGLINDSSKIINLDDISEFL